jgi:hypothetical protein
VATMYAHTYDPPPRPTGAAPHLPAAIDAVVERGMAKDPAQRYPAASGLIDAAQAALGLPPRAP